MKSKYKTTNTLIDFNNINLCMFIYITCCEETISVNKNYTCNIFKGEPVSFIINLAILNGHRWHFCRHIGQCSQ